MGQVRGSRTLSMTYCMPSASVAKFAFGRGRRARSIGWMTAGCGKLIVISSDCKGHVWIGSQKDSAVSNMSRNLPFMVIPRRLNNDTNWAEGCSALYHIYNPYLNGD
jgi:hypothetical protein